jgi:sulfur carrier protein ThiS adenylyltransferase
MKIKVSETVRECEVPATLHGVRERYKPEADVLILDGFPMSEDHSLCSGDKVVLIRRGEIPSAEEFEPLLTVRHTPGVHEKVKRAVVGIAGLGGLRSNVAFALARLGIGELILADFDVVEPSNLNRQQYFADQIGMSKVEALAESLARVNPCVRLRRHAVLLKSHNVPAIFQGARIIVEAFDGPEAKAMLINTVLERMPEAFVVGVSGLAGYGLSDGLDIRRFSKRCFVVGDGVTAARLGVGLMSPRVGVAAHHQANLVLRLLLDEERVRG